MHLGAHSGHSTCSAKHSPRPSCLSHQLENPGAPQILKPQFHEFQGKGRVCAHPHPPPEKLEATEGLPSARPKDLNLPNIGSLWNNPKHFHPCSPWPLGSCAQPRARPATPPSLPAGCRISCVFKGDNV